MTDDDYTSKNESALRTRLKICIVTQAGYLCSACKYETVIYGNHVPLACYNCGTLGLINTWRDRIKTNTTIETLARIV